MRASPATSILIAGAGPAGLTAAIELKRRGFAPRIIDPDLAVSPQSRALAINPRTLDLLEPSGVTEALLAAGHKITGAIIRYEQTPLFKLNIGLAPHRFNFLLSLPQSETERILAAALRDRGVRVERGVALQSFNADGPKIRLHLDDATEPDTDILIGADGAHSTVRKGLGFGFPGESQPQVFGLADVELDAWPFPWDMAVATIRQDHVVILLPMREGFGRFISTRPGTLQLVPPEARVGKIVWETDFHISYRQVQSYQRAGVFLAGDAAHIHSPVGGRGMNLGIEDACWLAWLIAEGRTAEYTALRHPVGARVLRLTAPPTRLIASNGFVARALRRWIVPGVLATDWAQRRLLPSMLALDTPAAPWL